MEAELRGRGRWRQGQPLYHDGPALGSGGPRLGPASQGEVSLLFPQRRASLSLSWPHVCVGVGVFVKQE